YADDTVYFAEAKMVFVCRKVYAAELQEKDFLRPEPIEQCYPIRDYHTLYIGKIEKILVRDDEYLCPGTSLSE
ncbi:MAG: hypothetical protein J6W50_01260, partial [Bacteroidaceae bacterium]|nr:hypothetical protein [Bacteroidaceae bacterium]